MPMPNSSTRETARTDFIKASVSIPAELELFAATRAGYSMFGGSFSAYVRWLIACDKDKPARLPLPEQTFQPGVFRTTVSLPGELESFISERAKLYPNRNKEDSNTSAYIRDLIIADQRAFVKLPKKQRASWRSPKPKVAA